MRKLNRDLIGAMLLMCGVLLLGGTRGAAVQPKRPNILFILTDDIGYGDLSCYGAKLVQTPNIDRLAQEGCRFTNVHSPASTCTPSRRAFLTGTYSWRQSPGSSIMPGDAPLSITPGSPTLPSLLKQAGYATGVIGKWHLGLGGEGGPDWNGSLTPGPREIGFDEHFLIPATGDRVPCVYVEESRVVGLDPADPIQVNYDKKIGNEPTGRENPELLKLKATHGHDNTIVNGVGRIGWMTGGKSARWKDEDMADTITSKAVSFLERHKDGPFFLYFSTHNIHVPRVPHPRHHGKSQCGTRGDAIVELDESVGTLLAALARLGLEENTMVIFTSDNGGRLDDGYEDVGNFEHPCNGVLRGRKGTIYEGGHRVPFLVRWKGETRPASESAEMFTYLDMMATFASLTGQPLAPGAAPDSFDVLPALLATPHKQPLRPHFVAHNGGVNGPFAVHQGSWKLVQSGEKPSTNDQTADAGKPELFDLSKDLSESKDLAADHPEKVKELTKLLRELRAQPDK